MDYRPLLNPKVRLQTNSGERAKPPEVEDLVRPWVDKRVRHTTRWRKDSESSDMYMISAVPIVGNKRRL